ncbi:MAG: ferredoxin family protein [Clostridiales bacterium]|nr:ferredoxin family protein [Clostridiales bacterium]
MPPIIHKESCVGCMNCTQICPMDCFGVQKKGNRVPEVRFPDECWHCNACVLECPAKAITLRVPLPSMMVFMEVPK